MTGMGCHTTRFTTVMDKIAKACRQIDTTADLIRQRHPEFADIPNDRPILGLAVTLEPFYLANASNLGPSLPTTQTPVCVASAADVEGMVTITDASVSVLLLERNACKERSTWDLGPALQGHSHRTNPVLDRAWFSSPWTSAMRSNETNSQ